MLGFDKKLVNHRLPIKKGFRSYKKPSRMAKVTFQVKKEFERMIKVKLVRTAKYV